MGGTEILGEPGCAVPGSTASNDLTTLPARSPRWSWQKTQWFEGCGPGEGRVRRPGLRHDAEAQSNERQGLHTEALVHGHTKPSPFAVPLCTFCTAGRVPWVR